jgi:hypothetical protein
MITASSSRRHSSSVCVLCAAVKCVTCVVPVAAPVRRRGTVVQAYSFVVQAAAVSCTATLPPTCKTTQCTWVLADRIAMDSWPCSMATTDALSRNFGHSCTVHAAPPISKSYCSHSADTTMHACPTGARAASCLAGQVSTRCPPPTASGHHRARSLPGRCCRACQTKHVRYTYKQVCGCRLPWRHRLTTSLPYKHTYR